MHVGNASEVRSWMAAFHSPRYLLSRGMHLVGAVAGKATAPRQIDLWERAALVNTRDGAGETLLHAALRGAQLEDRAERMRLLAWLLDMGAAPLRAAGGAVSPLELLLTLAAAAEGEADELWCELLSLLLTRTAAALPAAALVAQLGPLQIAFAPKLAERAPKTCALLVQPPPPPPASGSAFTPLPTPAEVHQGRSLVLLTLARVDLAGKPRSPGVSAVSVHGVQPLFVAPLSAARSTHSVRPRFPSTCLTHTPLPAPRRSTTPGLQVQALTTRHTPA